MKDLTWKIFCETGNINTYLLYKELEGAGNQVDGGFIQVTEESMGQLEVNP